MAEKTLKTRIVHKHDIEANWNLAKNFTPLQGEVIVYDIDTNYNYERIKIGDGQTNVIDLPFMTQYLADEIETLSETVVDLSDSVSVNYNESIIALSVDGTTVTYIKGDGSTHSFETQDTDTTYSLGTDTVTGLTKLYATTGSAEDGTMTQKAIKTELDKKVGVRIDEGSDILIFTI